MTGGPDVLATARAIESVLAIITQVFACGVEEDWELKVALSLLVTNGLDSHALCPLRRILEILRDAGNGNLLRADEKTGRLSIDLPQDFQACRSNRSTGPAPPDDSPNIDEALDDSTAAGFNDDSDDEDEDEDDGDDGKTDPGTSEEGIH